MHNGISGNNYLTPDDNGKIVSCRENICEVRCNDGFILKNSSSQSSEFACNLTQGWMPANNPECIGLLLTSKVFSIMWQHHTMLQYIVNSTANNPECIGLLLTSKVFSIMWQHHTMLQYIVNSTILNV